MTLASCMPTMLQTLWSIFDVGVCGLDSFRVSIIQFLDVVLYCVHKRTPIVWADGPKTRAERCSIVQ